MDFVLDDEALDSIDSLELIDEIEPIESLAEFETENEGLEFLDEETDSVIENTHRQLYIPKSLLSAGEIVILMRRMLRAVNPKYIDLAEKTALCVIKVYDYAKITRKIDFKIDRNKLIILSLLFTIGAYRQDYNLEIVSDSSEKEKEAQKIAHEFLYSYLYLRHMTPLKDAAEALLFYSTDWQKAKKLSPEYYEYASLIFTCMRICIKLKQNKYVFNSSIISDSFKEKCNELYEPEFLELFEDANENNLIVNLFANKAYLGVLDEYCESLQFNYDDSFTLLKFMLYTVDFISTSTVTHVISTSFLSTEICKVENLSDEETDEVFTASILHDIGKMAIPIEILESAGKLSDEEMEKMRSHVTEGDRIYRGVISDTIADIASRHHETLDGRGYPAGLTADDLTPQQRIISIADIFSALTDARTYKPSFPKEKTVTILQTMAHDLKIDPGIVDRVVEKYDSIKLHTEIRRPMLTANLGRVMLDYMRMQDCSNIDELFDMIHEEF